MWLGLLAVFVVGIVGTEAATFVCEGQSQTISCSDKPGTAIDIKFANYGRTSTEICVHATLPSSITDCPQQLDKALDIVKKECQDKTSCQLTASNAVFGDTCSGTYKYLEVNFECKLVNTFICEGQSQTLSCSDKPGTTIDIKFANYGRTSTEICIHATLPSSRTDCPQQLDKALDIVKTACQDKTSCQLTASNAVFGDTCSGTYKYLEVNFECKLVNTFICEGQSQTLSCSDKPGTAIDIKFANYGRTSTEICVHATLPSSRTDCPQQLDKALDIVKTECQDKITCQLTASNAVFGDTCSGTFKYLEVNFECKLVNTFICEGQSQTLSCSDKPGTAIDIKFANYGRTSTEVCVHATLPSSRTDCPQQFDKALEIVKTACQDKTSCQLTASNAVFGDTCSGTYKYLEVNFDCSEVDECEPMPCLNGATCHDLLNNYSCSCSPGYTGYNCETEVDECEPMPCLNGATCHDLLNNYSCSCSPGYTGYNCETEINECETKPCLNGATCHDLLNNYSCSCSPGYTGYNCETEIDECLPMPCLNGATCHDLFNNYSCSCAPGYTGYNCETEIDECEPMPCLNGATCHDLLNNYSCSCSPGYSGDNCEIELPCRPIKLIPRCPP